MRKAKDKPRTALKALAPAPAAPVDPQTLLEAALSEEDADLVRATKVKGDQLNKELGELSLQALQAEQRMRLKAEELTASFRDYETAIRQSLTKRGYDPEKHGGVRFEFDTMKFTKI